MPVQTLVLVPVGNPVGDGSPVVVEKQVELEKEVVLILGPGLKPSGLDEGFSDDFVVEGVVCHIGRNKLTFYYLKSGYWI